MSNTARYFACGAIQVALPVLAGSAAYAVAEAMDWEGSLDLRLDRGQGIGFYAVLAASIFHFGEYSIPQAKRHMAAAGLPMRLDGLEAI